MCSLSLCTFQSFQFLVKCQIILCNNNHCCHTTSDPSWTVEICQAGAGIEMWHCMCPLLPWLGLEWPSSSVIKILVSSAASCRAAWCLAGAGSGDNTETRAGSETGEDKVDNVASGSNSAPARLLQPRHGLQSPQNVKAKQIKQFLVSFYLTHSRPF